MKLTATLVSVPLELHTTNKQGRYVVKVIEGFQIITPDGRNTGAFERKKAIKFCKAMGWRYDYKK